MSEHQVSAETTRDRIARILRDLAAEEQPSAIGKMVQVAYGMGMGGAIVEALPEDDAAADAQLEYLAGVVLALRSPASIARNPFEPVFGTLVEGAPADPVGDALSVNEAEVSQVFASLGLGAVALGDLQALAAEMEREGLESWAGITLAELRVEIAAKLAADPDPLDLTPELAAEPFRDPA